MLRKDNSEDNFNSTKMNGKNVVLTPESSSNMPSDAAPATGRGLVPNRKQHKKLVRLLTVAAYVFFVSLGAIVLSLYYVFLWDPQMDKVSRRFTATEVSTEMSDMGASTMPPMLYIGGSVIGTITRRPPGSENQSLHYPDENPGN